MDDTGAADAKTSDAGASHTSRLASDVGAADAARLPDPAGHTRAAAGTGTIAF